MKVRNRPVDGERPVSNQPDSLRVHHLRRPRFRTTDLNDILMGAMLLAGPANIVMQLARPAVGYGVVESRVESGRGDLHPIKRARTTFTYLVTAIAGSAVQKAALHRAIADVHSQVYSTHESPIVYDARDPELQLWVAACLYKGLVDVRRLYIGEVSEEDAERHYREAMALGTTLQVPPQMWPADRAAFERYWKDSLDKVHIDETVREYLYTIAAGRVRGLKPPEPLRHWLENRALLITTGFLPQRFRDEMRLPWDPNRQRRFDRLMALVASGNRLMPRVVRRFPFNLLLWDLERRIRSGRPLL